LGLIYWFYFVYYDFSDSYWYKNVNSYQSSFLSQGVTPVLAQTKMAHITYEIVVIKILVIFPFSSPKCNNHLACLKTSYLTY